MADIILNIAKDFSRCPGARFSSEGDFSGEEFRNNCLVPKLREAIEQGVRLKIILDGSAGYSTAFIEESFGGLIRINGFTLNQLQEKLLFVSDEDPSYIDDIKTYMKNAWEYR